MQYIVPILTFTGPCILIYSYNKNQQDALFLNFILVKNWLRPDPASRQHH